VPERAWEFDSPLSHPSDLRIIPANLRQVDIATLLGISKQRVHQLARGESFPPPARRQEEREFWRKSDVSRWAKRHPVGDRRLGSSEGSVLATLRRRSLGRLGKLVQAPSKP